MQEAISTGEKIQRTYPTLPLEWKEGRTFLELIEQYQLTGVYKKSAAFLQRALTYTVRGNQDAAGGICYPGVYAPEVCDEIARQHMSERGTRCYITKTGIFGLGETQQRAIRKKGGTQSYNQRKGIHNLTSEEKRVFATQRGYAALRDKSGLFGHSKRERAAWRKKGLAAIQNRSPRERQIAARKGIETRGQKVWSDAEKAYVTAQAAKPKYQMGSRVNITRLAEAVNNKFYAGKPIRTAFAIGRALAKQRENSRLEKLAVHEE